MMLYCGGGQIVIRRRGRRFLKLVTSAALLLPGCGSEPDTGKRFDFGPAETWSSEHFRYHVRPGDSTACPAVLETFEAHSDLLSAYLDTAPESWLPLDYYKFPKPEELTASGVCWYPDASACYQARNIYSSIAFDDHELAHALAAPLGKPPKFLTEGFAVALSCSPEGLFGSIPMWRDAYEHGDYQHAGAFVTNLIDTFGVEKLRQLYETTSTGASADEFASIFRELYGIEVGDIWNQLLRKSEHRACLAMRACNSAEIELGTTELAWDCASQTIARKLSVSTDQPLLIRAEGGSPALRSCSADSAVVELSVFDLLQGDTWFLVPGGQYALELERLGSEVPRSSTLSVEHLAGASFSGCSSAEAMPAPKDLAWQLLIGPTDEPIFLHFSLAAPGRLTVDSLHGSIGEGFHAELCASCVNGSALDCVPFLVGDLGYDSRDVEADFHLKLTFTPAQRRLVPLYMQIDARN